MLGAMLILILLAILVCALMLAAMIDRCTDRIVRALQMVNLAVGQTTHPLRPHSRDGTTLEDLAQVKTTAALRAAQRDDGPIP